MGANPNRIEDPHEGWKWLAVDVYRGAHGRDSTLGGVTSRHAQLYVPHPDGNHEDPPAAQRLVLGRKGGVSNFVPASVGSRWASAGGNFVWTSDGRFRDLYGDDPVAVHDRIEPTRAERCTADLWTAIRSGNWKAASRIADTLRMQEGWKYSRFVEEFGAEWESHVQAMDEADAGGDS